MRSTLVRTATAVCLCFTSSLALAHEGQGEHSHGEPGPAPPAVQPTVASQDLAVEEPGAVVAPVDEPAAEPDTEDRVAQPPPPHDAPPPAEGTDPGYRPRTLEDNTWRRRIRDLEEGEGSDFIDATHFFFELRFGPYWPAVDDSLSTGSYEAFFGDKPRFYFGLEADYLPIYIPYVLSLGPGFGWGFTKASGEARRADDPNGEPVPDSDTSLTMFPMHLSAVARIDGPLRELDIPIVPYIKGGFGFAVWRTGGGTNNPSGTSGGLHLAVGGSIALNAFDPQTAMAMREDTGIRYAHVFGEWMYDNLSQGLNVGTSTAIFGLGLEL